MFSYNSLTPCLLLITALTHRSYASLGVVDIDELLEPGTQKPLAEQPLNHGPWTHKPECSRSPSPSTTKYCVYTNGNAFTNGISIISTPAVATASIPHLSEDSLSNFFDDDQTEEWFSSDRPWKVVDIEGKDQGVVATRRIKKYEMFMVDQASVVMDLGVEKEVGKDENLRLLRVGVERLGRPGVVRGLSGRRGKSGDGGGGGKGEEGWEEDVMMTNSFGTEVSGVEVRALFPLVSRINHDCDPNAFVMFSNSGLTAGIKAYRTILPGEEISISYLNLGVPYQKRQDALKRWNFTCTCALCSRPASSRTQSDSRRQRIEALTPDLLSHWREGKHQAAIHTGEEIIELMKEEGLTPLLPDQYVILARLHLLRGEREIAEEYADGALDILGDLGFLGREGRDGIIGGEEWGLERLLKSFQGV